MQVNNKNKINLNKIKGLLIISGKQYNDLANLLNLSYASINDMLNGRRNISAIRLKVIADFLNVSVDSLYS